MDHTPSFMSRSSATPVIKPGAKNQKTLEVINTILHHLALVGISDAMLQTLSRELESSKYAKEKGREPTLKAAIEGGVFSTRTSGHIFAILFLAKQKGDDSPLHKIDIRETDKLLSALIPIADEEFSVPLVPDPRSYLFDPQQAAAHVFAYHANRLTNTWYPSLVQEVVITSVLCRYMNDFAGDKPEEPKTKTTKRARPLTPAPGKPA